MKKDILILLRRHAGEYLSGEDLSRQLGVSRTAVWKHIQSLRDAGYQIDSQPRRGHCLVAVPDKLYPQEISAGLTAGRIGQAIHYFEEVRSTNEEARRLAERGAEEGTLVLAESQTGGKGRLGRHWLSPAGKGVWLSLILRPPIQPAKAPHLTMVAAVAAARAVEEASGLKAGIKWPNDILVNGKKVCGILTELKAEAERVHYAVVGIGLNVNLSPADLPPELHATATSLAIETGHPVSRVLLTQGLLVHLEAFYTGYLAQGFGLIKEAWEKMNVTLGRPVQVTAPEGRFSGIALDIDADGALLVAGEGGIRAFYAGDVTLRAKG
ncbi:MAG: biotin--[acetyl-CoA-carboxylase] ligase [Bacillota bacterium]